MRLARRRPHRVVALVAVSGLAAAGLAGCQLFEIQEPERTPSAMEQCISANTWVLDLESMRVNVAERLADLGASGEIAVEGEQTLRWGLDGTVRLESDLRIDVTNPGPPVLHVEQTIDGASGGSAVFSGDVAIPRKWSEAELLVVERMTQDDEPVDPAPWELGRVWLDDTVGLVMTCTADTLDVDARGSILSWTFHPEGWTPPVEPTEGAEEGDGEATPTD